MNPKRKVKPRDTYIFDEDVMDEMENFEDTIVDSEFMNALDESSDDDQ